MSADAAWKTWLDWTTRAVSQDAQGIHAPSLSSVHRLMHTEYAACGTQESDAPKALLRHHAVLVTSILNGMDSEDDLRPSSQWWWDPVQRWLDANSWHTGEDDDKLAQQPVAKRRRIDHLSLLQRIRSLRTASQLNDTRLHSHMRTRSVLLQAWLDGTRRLDTSLDLADPHTHSALALLQALENGHTTTEEALTLAHNLMQHDQHHPQSTWLAAYLLAHTRPSTDPVLALARQLLHTSAYEHAFHPWMATNTLALDHLHSTPLTPDSYKHILALLHTSAHEASHPFTVSLSLILFNTFALHDRMGRYHSMKTVARAFRSAFAHEFGRRSTTVPQHASSSSSSSSATSATANLPWRFVQVRADGRIQFARSVVELLQLRMSNPLNDYDASLCQIHQCVIDTRLAMHALRVADFSQALTSLRAIVRLLLLRRSTIARLLRRTLSIDPWLLIMAYLHCLYRSGHIEHALALADEVGRRLPLHSKHTWFLHALKASAFLNKALARGHAHGWAAAHSLFEESCHSIDEALDHCQHAHSRRALYLNRGIALFCMGRTHRARTTNRHRALRAILLAHRMTTTHDGEGELIDTQHTYHVAYNAALALLRQGQTVQGCLLWLRTRGFPLTDVLDVYQTALDDRTRALHTSQWNGHPEQLRNSPELSFVSLDCWVLSQWKTIRAAAIAEKEIAQLAELDIADDDWDWEGSAIE